MLEKRCIGFDEFEGRCDRVAGSSHSKLWCQRCDDLRLASLERQFKEIARDLEHHRSQQ